MKGTATWMLGDVFDRVPELTPGSVQSVITSPPYWRKRRYLPVDHPDADLELGQEPSPGEFLAGLLRLTDLLWDVVADDGTIWFNLGDTASGSGGWGGDVTDGTRAGGQRWDGSGKATQYKESQGDVHRHRTGHGARASHGAPRPKSVCWIPELFGASLAYGQNLLTGEPCRQWITRPSVVWCKPSPTPGEIIDKFREATELIVWASKQPSYYFDLDAVREPAKDDPRLAEVLPVSSGAFAGHPDRHGSRPDRVANEKGVPPLTWWVINSGSFEGAHYATFPPELIRRPVIASCPPGGTILDPFAGSGTTLAVAVHHGRNAIGIDLDERNLALNLERVGSALQAADDAEAERLAAIEAERWAGSIFDQEGLAS